MVSVLVSFAASGFINLNLSCLPTLHLTPLTPHEIRHQSLVGNLLFCEEDKEDSRNAGQMMMEIAEREREVESLACDHKS